MNIGNVKLGIRYVMDTGVLGFLFRGSKAVLRVYHETVGRLFTGYVLLSTMFILQGFFNHKAIVENPGRVGGLSVFSSDIEVQKMIAIGFIVYGIVLAHAKIIPLLSFGSIVFSVYGIMLVWASLSGSLAAGAVISAVNLMGAVTGINVAAYSAVKYAKLLLKYNKLLAHVRALEAQLADIGIFKKVTGHGRNERPRDNTRAS